MGNRGAPHKRAIIGETSKETRTYIENSTGRVVRNINIDNSGIIHAMGKAAHNLEADDLLYAVEVINTSSDITVSPKKHLSNTVLIFKKDIGGGELTILTEVHEKGDYLVVFDAWRQKKALRYPTANKPSANVQDDSQHADTSLSPQSAEKSSVLFQLSEDYISGEARNYECWEAWRDDIEGAGFLAEDRRPDFQDRKQIDEWYEQKWNEANGVTRGKAKKPQALENLPAFFSSRSFPCPSLWLYCFAT
jgi:hypothetical protein